MTQSQRHLSSGQFNVLESLRVASSGSNDGSPFQLKDGRNIIGDGQWQFSGGDGLAFNGDTHSDSPAVSFYYGGHLNFQIKASPYYSGIPGLSGFVLRFAAVREFLDTADEELRRVAHMTRQSLGLYREAVIPTHFCVDTLMDSVLSLLKNKIRAKAVTIERRHSQDVFITAVFGEIRQVLVNLITNSLDALSTGGTIKLRTAVSTDGAHARRRIRIVVADTGKGIGVEQRTRIFEPFFTTKGELGTGLGLWVTRQLIEKHNGTIQVRSRVGGLDSGTVFCVTLPE